MPLYDFLCPERHVTEAIRPPDAREVACSCCDLTATRQFSSRVAIVGPTTDMRGMFRRYQEAASELPPSTTSALWGTAKSRARAMTVAGEAPPVPKER